MAPECDDGLYCNGVEICDADAGCEAGEPVSCDDEIECTVDACDESEDRCVSTVDDSHCDDGAFCNGVETCDASAGCQPGASVVCADDLSCTVDECDEEADACTHELDDAACDDGVYCNGPETCDAAQGCTAGLLPCDDGVACTVDECDEVEQSCASFPSDLACDDGLFCNGAETCSADSGCTMGTPLDCGADDSTCGTGVCDEASQGCVVAPINEGLECTDGDDACTLNDACLDGTCVGIPLCDPQCALCLDGTCLSLCGNPFEPASNRITVVDALFSLRASVALEQCPLCICDVNADGTVTALDTMSILRYYVGLDEALACPEPAVSTTTSTTSTSTVTTSTMPF